MPTNHSHGFAVQVEDEYGVCQFVASVYYVDPDDGDLCRPRWDTYRQPGHAIRHLADFSVRAFLDSSVAPVPYGIRHCYTPTELELDQAETIVKTLRRLRRGLDAIQRAEGHLPDGDYAGYLIRIGRILRLDTYHVRNTPQERETTGQFWKRTDTTGLQTWVTHRIADATTTP